MDLQQAEWNEAYDKRQNYLFYPHEEVIRFVSKHFRRRVGRTEYVDLRPFQPAPLSLNLGCGIGRHVIYLGSVGFDSYGIDISSHAVQTARNWAAEEGFAEPGQHILEGSADELPWDDGFFNCVVSHGVLDSMRFEVARHAIAELDRVLEKAGLAYVDLISGDESNHFREYDGEEVLKRDHEMGTVQSYFNAAKIL